MSDDEGRLIQAEIEDAEAAVAEQGRLQRRLEAAERDRDRAHGALVQARDRLTRELGDVSLEGLDELRVTDLTRTFDVWFDNIFSDWSVRNRIDDARRRTEGAVQAVAEVRVKLRGRREEIEWELGDLARRRTALLGAAGSG